MMKILFINPYIYDFTAFDLWLKPLGLLYVAAAVRKYSNCEMYWIDVLDRFQSLESQSKETTVKKNFTEIKSN